jgi:hypothetical protein
MARRTADLSHLRRALDALRIRKGSAASRAVGRVVADLCDAEALPVEGVDVFAMLLLEQGQAVNASGLEAGDVSAASCIVVGYVAAWGTRRGPSRRGMGSRSNRCGPRKSRLPPAEPGILPKGRRGGIRPAGPVPRESR